MQLVNSKYHDSSLRISSRGFIESRPINNTKSINSKNSIIGFHNLTNITTTMEMPHNNHSILIKLLQGLNIISVFRNKINISLHTYIPAQVWEGNEFESEPIYNLFKTLIQPLSFNFYKLNFKSNPFSTLPHIQPLK